MERMGTADSGLHIVAYDVVDDRRRLRVTRVLGGYGRRVQYSVFEARLARAQVTELLAGLGRVLDPAEDRVHLIRVCRDCARLCSTLGTAEPLGVHRRAEVV